MIPIQITLRIVLRSPIDNKPSLVHAIARQRTGDKPLPDSIMTHITDAYMRY